MGLSLELRAQIAKAWRLAFRNRQGNVCLFTYNYLRYGVGCPPYEMDAQGYGVGFCNVEPDTMNRNKLRALRRISTQAARARERQQKEVNAMQDQPVPPRAFTSLEEAVLDPATLPTVRRVLVDSARHAPKEALAMLRATRETPADQRTAVGLTHTLQLQVPPELFLQCEEEMKAAAREALGL